ncbi:long-chain fatty acid--CoA ligase [Roseiconus nitratireducens]|uniref:Long-chain fatty acid--CoA ligase n=1 Tax=Roseiconus nitratireducens TaxID=2605748 RepID=A0A5M6D4N5_9BACT|nr:AMP-binding protein [Roseiconus nitratireducens]KAA5540719.1 long-chain fatty acid--CoA ligase [Roseiconus nitratireducens]
MPTLVGSILRHGLFRPRQTAVVDDRAEYSYGKLLLGTWHLASHIEKHTDNPHVGIMLPPSGSFPMTLLGTWLLNRTAVPLNYLLRKNELRYVIEDSGIDTLFTVGKLLEVVGTEGVIPDHVKVVCVDELDFKGLPRPRFPRAVDAQDGSVILYTSGTSGKPKGVMLTEENFLTEIKAIDDAAHGLEIKTFLGVLPQFHSFGLTALTLWPLSRGNKIVYSARFVPRKLHKLICQHRPNVFFGVPAMFNAMLSLKQAEPADFESLKFSVAGGEPLPRSVTASLKERFHLQVYEGYGLTETAPVTNCNVPGKIKEGTVGKALLGVRNVIVDDEGNQLGPDQDGEILIVGKNIMKGYYKLDQQTHDVITQINLDGKPVRAFKTGDIGHLDRDGFLSITGRKKEMLIVSGENVFPREIEEVLDQHESVKASAIIGIKSELRGELPLAFVELNDGYELDEQALKTFLREHLAPFKVPKEIRAIEELPRNPTGKIMRRELKA